MMLTRIIPIELDTHVLTIHDVVANGRIFRWRSIARLGTIPYEQYWNGHLYEPNS